MAVMDIRCLTLQAPPHYYRPLMARQGHLYCVDLEVWSKLAKCVRFMRSASKCAHDFDCEWQRVNAFSHCFTLIRALLSQIISYSDTKVPVLVVMECKCANVIYVYELIFLLSRSTECTNCASVCELREINFPLDSQDLISRLPLKIYDCQYTLKVSCGYRLMVVCQTIIASLFLVVWQLCCPW